MRYLFIILSLWCFSYCSAQKFEPKWVGQVYLLLVDSDTTAIQAERANVQVKKTASAGRILAGIGNIRTKAVIKGGRSSVQLPSDKSVVIVVKCKDNDTDPSTFIQVVKFEESKRERKAELGKINWLDNVSQGNMNIMPYVAEKYGKSSYILVLEPHNGEFGVLITNPDADDQKIPVFSCFGLHDLSSLSTSLVIRDGAEFFDKDGVLFPVYKTSEGLRYIMLSKTDKYFLPVSIN